MELECTECFKVFQDEAILKGHMLRHEIDRRYKCPKCPKASSSLKGIIAHVRQGHDGGHTCTVCGVVFSCYRTHRDHLRNNHPRYKHKCVICPETFPEETSLSGHMQTHEVELEVLKLAGNTGGHICSVCGMKSHSQRSHRDHLRTHSRPKHKCAICSEMFAEERELYNHRLTRHLTEAEVLKAAGNDAFITRDISYGDVQSPEPSFTGSTSSTDMSPSSFRDSQVNEKLAVDESASTLENIVDLTGNMDVTAYVQKPHKCYHCVAEFESLDELDQHLNLHVGQTPTYSDNGIKDETSPIDVNSDKETREEPTPMAMYSNNGGTSAPTPIAVYSNDRTMEPQTLIASTPMYSHNGELTEPMDINSSNRIAAEPSPIAMYSDDRMTLSPTPITIAPIYSDDGITQPTPITIAPTYSDDATTEQVAPINIAPIYTENSIREQPAPIYSNVRNYRSDNPVSSVTPEGYHRCIECKKCFPNVAALSDHLWEHAETPAGKYSCPYCYKVHHTTFDLNSHIATHTVKPFACHLCSKKYSWERYLVKHMEKKHGVGATSSRREQEFFQCFVCRMKFAWKNSLKQHMNKVHGVNYTKSDTCPRCGCRFGPETDITEHIRGCIPRVPAVSTVEQTVTVSPVEPPNDNMETGDKDCVYSCTHCTDSFSDEADLTEHNKIHMSDTLAKHPTMLSFLTGQSNGAMASSEATNGLPRCNSLPNNNKEMVNGSDHLRKHSQDTKSGVHSETEQPLQHKGSYQCGLCTHQFVKKGYLQQHMRSIHQTGLYACTDCGKTFEWKFLFQKHRETHSKSRTRILSNIIDSLFNENNQKSCKEVNKCSQCTLTFGDLHSLQRHTVTHTQARPYPCGLCSHRFTQRGHLEQHRRTIHQLGLYNCCGHTFEWMYLLQKHKETQCEQNNVVPLHRVSVTAELVLQQEKLMKADGQKVHKCLRCSLTFEHLSEMLSHALTHKRLHPYQCVLCSSSFTQETSLNLHTTIVHKVARHSCSPCGETFEFASLLQIHQAKYAGRCAAACGDNNDTAKNKETVAGNVGVYKSVQERFSDKIKLKHHNQLHLKDDLMYNSSNHGQAGNKCQDSLVQEQVSRNSLNAGKPGSQEAELYTCSSCTEVFQTSDLLEQHTETHTALHDLSRDQKVFVKVEDCSSSMSGGQSSDIVRPSSVRHNQSSNAVNSCSMKDSQSSDEVDTSSLRDTESSNLSNSSSMKDNQSLNSRNSSSMEDIQTAGSVNSSSLTGSKASGIGDSSSMKDKESSDVVNSESPITSAPMDQEATPLATTLVVSDTPGHAEAPGDTETPGGTGVHRCVHCGKEFTTDGFLQKHLQLHQADTCHRCVECGQTFLTRSCLTNHTLHIHTQYAEQLETCPVCNEKFQDSVSLIQHMLTHENDVSTLKEAQDANMVTSHSLKPSQPRTIKQITSDTYHKTKCKFTDASSKELRIVSGIRMKHCKCFLCGNMFRRPSDLSRHMMIHTGLRPYPCSFCPAGFIQIHTLKQHTVQYHKDQAVLPDKQNVEKGQDTADTDTLTNENQKDDSAITDKKDRATSDKPAGFDCCGTRFTTLTQVQHHWLVHKEEKPFPCPHCDVRFTKRFTRTKHIMYLHPGTRPKCSDCGEEFTQFQDLVKHMEVHEEKIADLGETLNGETLTGSQCTQT